MKESHEQNGDSDSIIRMGIINVEEIDVNGDGRVFQDPMDWNVISDEDGRCPVCGMFLKEVTIDEAKRLFMATWTLSFRVFYFTLYSMGLRLGEGLRLEVGDIDASRQRVHIRNAKGNKDRLVPLPQATLDLLRRFWQIHRHPALLFPNRRGGLKAVPRATSPLDRGGVQTTLRKVVAECGIKKTLPHIVCVTAMPPI